MVNNINGDNMRILIIGARGGIAYLAAKKLSVNNDVYLCVHTTEQLKSIKEKIKLEKLNIKSFKLDITNENDLNLLDKLHYDVIWSHAGIGNGGTLLAMNKDVLVNNYETNVFGTVEVIKRAYSNFIKNNIKGKIFITSSLAGKLPLPYLSCYTSSKAALSMIVTTLKEELKKTKSNISISLIEPGAYKTGFNEVMIENKEKYLEKDSIFYNDLNNINRLQKNLFTLIEKENYTKLVNKIIKEMEKEVPKFRIREPLIQVIFTKLYLLFYG